MKKSFSQNRMWFLSYSICNVRDECMKGKQWLHKHTLIFVISEWVFHIRIHTKCQTAQTAFQMCMCALCALCARSINVTHSKSCVENNYVCVYVHVVLQFQWNKEKLFIWMFASFCYCYSFYRCRRTPPQPLPPSCKLSEKEQLLSLSNYMEHSATLFILIVY